MRGRRRRRTIIDIDVSEVLADIGHFHLALDIRELEGLALATITNDHHELVAFSNLNIEYERT